MDGFAFKDLSFDARGADFRIRPHITKIVKMGLEGPQSGIHFPLKERYRKCNLTVEGREESYNRWDDTVSTSKVIDKPICKDAETDTSDLLDDKGDSEDVGDVAVPEPELPPMVPKESYYYDSIGRRYRADEFGNKIVRSTRPPTISSEDWKKAGSGRKGKEEKRKIIETFKAAGLALGDKDIPPAASATDADIEDMEFEICRYAEESFLQSIEDYCAPVDGFLQDACIAAQADDGVKVKHTRRARQRQKNKIPRMPRGTDAAQGHRPKLAPPWGIPACIAMPVSKKEVEAKTVDGQAARNARDAEWKKLWDNDVWDSSVVREWGAVAKEARVKGQEIHLGRLSSE